MIRFDEAGGVEAIFTENTDGTLRLDKLYGMRPISPPGWSPYELRPMCVGASCYGLARAGVRGRIASAICRLNSSSAALSA